MKILLTGSQGQVGQAVIQSAKNADIALLSCDKKILDITDEKAVSKIIKNSEINAIINAAAYTAVDKAESEPEKAFAVNAKGPENLAKIAADYDIPLIHFSTDYVFDGTKTSAYKETDKPNPLNIYGQSKWSGEEAVRKYCEKHIILRVSWVFGEHGNNFVKTMLRLMKEREKLEIIADQKGCPTYAGDIAEIAVRLITGAYSQWGTYHYTGLPQTSWYDFARKIYSSAQKYFSLTLKPENILPISTTQYPLPAKRPQNSVLACDLFENNFKIKLNQWEKGLEKMLEKFC